MSFRQYTNFTVQEAQECLRRTCQKHRAKALFSCALLSVEAKSASRVESSRDEQVRACFLGGANYRENMSQPKVCAFNHWIDAVES
jgi:hypothetical protein